VTDRLPRLAAVDFPTPLATMSEEGRAANPVGRGRGRRRRPWARPFLSLRHDGRRRAAYGSEPPPVVGRVCQRFRPGPQRRGRPVLALRDGADL
jgi:hypothetical protein